MAAQSAQTATDALLATTPVTLLGVHWVGGTATGNVTLRDGTTATTTARIKIQTGVGRVAGGGPNPAGFVDIGGGGIRFNSAIYGDVNGQAGGVTIIYATTL